MTQTSLDNLVINLQIHQRNLAEKVNNKLKYDLNCMCDEKRDLLIADAIIDTFICYQLPCPDSEDTCTTRLAGSQIASETCGGTFTGNLTIYTNAIDNVLNTSISTLGLEAGIYLSSPSLQSGTYITDIIVGVTTSTLVINKQALLTKPITTITVDCSAITYTSKSSCLSPTEMVELLKILNKIFCTNYCVDFEITIDE